MWKVKVPNIGTQFRSRDQYTEATIKIISEDTSLFGEVLDPGIIPDVPKRRVGSIDKYLNIKTTIRRSEIPDDWMNYPILRVTINGISNFILNTLIEGISGERMDRIGDLCMVKGSSGGRKDGYIEFVRLYGEAAKDWNIVDAPIDELGEIKIEPVQHVIYNSYVSPNTGERKIG